MAHEFESGFFAKNNPAWHGLGTVVKDSPSVSAGLALAGLAWDVIKEPCYLSDGRMIPGHFATLRETDRAPLGVVGPDWTPLQNSHAFDWFEPLVESGLVTLETAGSLRGGKKVWVLAKIETVEVMPGDAVTQYVLLSNDHAGKASVRVGFTEVRVVCMNTMRAAHNSEASKLVKVRHNTRVVQSLEAVRSLLDVAKAEFVGSQEQFQALAKKPCGEETLRRYIREVFQPGKGEDPHAAKTQVGRIMPYFEEGAGAELSRGTMWGALNSVTEFVTHGQGRSQDGRLDSQWFGQGAKLIERAREVALDFGFFDQAMLATETHGSSVTPMLDAIGGNAGLSETPFLDSILAAQ